jgi:hypothetical protein
MHLPPAAAALDTVGASGAASHTAGPSVPAPAQQPVEPVEHSVSGGGGGVVEGGAQSVLYKGGLEALSRHTAELAARQGCLCRLTCLDLQVPLYSLY